MKFASFVTGRRHGYGVVTDEELRPVPQAFAARFPTLREAIAGDALAEAAAAADASAPIARAEADFLPPIPNPDKIICVGRNYAAHAAESNSEPPEFPSLFLRLTNTLVAHHKPVVRPRLSGDFDYEGELAVIIGKGGRHISEENALEHVAGYSCFMDGSVRDFQFGHSLIAGKNFMRTGGFGAYMTTADEAPDPSALTVVTRLNGVEMQRGHVRDMIFSISYLIAYLSGITELVAGDVIATGTPEGVGFAREPQIWMQHGDTVEVEIEGVSVLRHPAMHEDSNAN